MLVVALDPRAAQEQQRRESGGGLVFLFRSRRRRQTVVGAADVDAATGWLGAERRPRPRRRPQGRSNGPW